MGKSTLVISLDFELHWGMFDKLEIEEYEDELIGVRESLPKVLELFAEYGIHATWATVGLLFFESRQALEAALPAIQPTYDNEKLSAYRHLDRQIVGENEAADPYHYAPSLIKLIRSYPHQEIGTHTFSHYYCLEKGQTVEAFRADLERAVSVSNAHDISLKSLVLPRNQCSDPHLAVCRELGIDAYRGTEESWLYQPKSGEDEFFLRRLIRLADAYLPISGTHSTSWESLNATLPINIPSSRFLRAYSPKLRHIEPLRLRRILNEIRYAAKHDEIYHIWWHPQDFGRNIPQNLGFLKAILETYKEMSERYGMQSLHMGEIAEATVTGVGPAPNKLQSLP